jgi:hypothetical protein
MAASCELAFLRQFELESTIWIDVDIGGGEVNASVAAGYYDTMFDFISALETSLQVVDATFAVIIENAADIGHVRISRTGSYSILWNTGTNTANNVGELLGFDTSADDTGAATYLSDNQHQHGWYSPVGPSSDSYDRPQSMGPGSFVGMSSRIERVSWATHFIREIKFNNVEIEKLLASDADLNEDLETFWIGIAEAWPFDIFSSLELVAASWVDEGQYALEVDENPDLLAGVPRLSPGSAYYSFSLSLRKRNP